MFGEELQQHAVRHAAVDNDRPFHTLVHRIDTGLHFRDHAAGDRTVFLQIAALGDGQVRHQRARLIKHARDVGQHQQPRGIERTGQRTGHGVRVNVVGVAFGVPADGRDHRDDTFVAHGFEDIRIDLLGLADKAKVDDFFDIRIRIAAWCAPAF